MVRAVESNLEMIGHVAKRLGELRDRVVFLGGWLLRPDQADMQILRVEHDEIFAVPSLRSVFLRVKKGR